jgi:hypothetical protein
MEWFSPANPAATINIPSVATEIAAFMIPAFSPAAESISEASPQSTLPRAGNIVMKPAHITMGPPISNHPVNVREFICVLLLIPLFPNELLPLSAKIRSSLTPIYRHICKRI